MSHPAGKRRSGMAYGPGGYRARIEPLEPRTLLDAVPLIADGLNLSRAEVHGVISFYHYFRHTPPGRHTIQVCRAEACRSMNGASLEAHARQRLRVEFHETTSSGAFTLEPVYCLGNCALSPAIQIDGKLHGRVTRARFDELASEELA